MTPHWDQSLQRIYDAEQSSAEVIAEAEARIEQLVKENDELKKQVKKITEGKAPALFPKVPAPVTEEDREYALTQLSDAVENINRAVRAIERGFCRWPQDAYIIASPDRLLSETLSDLKRQVGRLGSVADNVLNIRATS